MAKPILYIKQRRISAGRSTVEMNMFDWTDYISERITTAPQGAIFVETGTYNAQSLIYFLEQSFLLGRTDLKIFTCDVFDGATVQPKPCIYNVAQAIKLYEMRYKEDAFKRCSIMQCDALKLAGYFADGEVYHVFLDDNHELNHVSAELEAWYPKVTEGGYLAGHDYASYPQWQNMDVIPAVDAFVAKNSLTLNVVDKNSFSIIKPFKKKK